MFIFKFKGRFHNGLVFALAQDSSQEQDFP
jgi:hypothetical protein